MAAPKSTLPSARMSSMMLKQSACTTTSDDNITGTNSTVYIIKVTSAASNTNFVKIYDAKTATVSIDPQIVFPVTAGQTQVVTCIEGITMTNGFSWRCVDAGGTGGVNNPTGGNIAVLAVVA
tara:strand:+ start:1195 stop:1560 length:366 start_codon:yes stop_codon:yes gene_type:complete